MMRKFFLTSLSTILSLTVVAGCRTAATIVAQRPIPMNGYDGRWVGPVRPDDASCGTDRTGVLVIRDTSFAFDPFQGALTLRGTNDETGHLAGTQMGGAGNNLSLSFVAQASTDANGEESVVGVLTSGKCRWQVALRRG